jgi:cellulose synthase/poly-beta-1,6-N-acetylglucosamine synthase-like glycosyltransferase
LTTLLIAIGVLVLAVWVWRYRMITGTLREDPFLRARAEASPSRLIGTPTISVLIPARNEAGNIPRALDALLAQNYPAFEVIVTDDRSEDDTPHIVRSFLAKDRRLRLLESRELPEGWTGKSYALWQAAREARGEILLFHDADVALDPGALSVITSYFVENRLDMLSLILRLDSRSFWEKSLRVLAGSVLLFRFPLSEVNDPKSPRAFANGQLIMMRSEVYRAVGGHRRVKSILLEDIALAGLVKHEGHRLGLAYGFDVAAARMYSSLGDFWKGWTRIFYSALRGSPARLLAAALLLTVFSLSPYIALIFAAVLLAAQGVSPAPLALLFLAAAEIALLLRLMVKLHRMSRCESAYALLHLPASVILLGILLSAMSKRFSQNGIEWKGVRYDTRRNLH